MDESTRAVTLADLVEAHAPTLIAAAAPWGARADGEIARSLVAVWQAGPPHEAAIDALARELATGPNGTSPRTSRSPGPAPDPDFVRIASIHRLAQSYRVAGRRRGRRVATIVATALLGLAVIVVALVLILPRLAGSAAAPAPSSTAAVPATPAPTPTPPATPTSAPSAAPTATPTASPSTSPSTSASSTGPGLTCNSQYCLPPNTDTWGTLVVAAAYDQLDRDNAFSAGGIIGATSLSSNPTGSLLSVTVSGAETGTSVEVWAAKRADRLPACGAQLEIECQATITRRGDEVLVARTGNVIEARVRSGDDYVQIVLRNPDHPLGISLESMYDFLLDQRLQLPS